MSDARPADQIIDEVRRNREQLLRASGGSIDTLFAAIKDAEAKESRPVIKLPSRPVRKSDSDAA
ncbi:MAG: hypothetical protein U0572_13340 [Phycisphaerales bacterium]